MGCNESKSGTVDADEVRVRLEEAETAMNAELERIEREGAVRLRHAQERVEADLAQCKATDFVNIHTPAFAVLYAAIL